jgi:regulator of sigma E protease
MAANGQPIWRFNELIQIVAASNGQPVALQIWREGAVIDLDISPRRQDILKEDRSFETRWLLGVSSSSFFEPATEMPGPVAAFSSAVVRTWDVAASSVSGLYHIAAQKISSCNMSGAITIAKTSGKMASSGLVDFIAFLAFLSTAIGLVNLFPIPVLDGGHLMFYAYEAVVGRGPSEKVVQVLMSVGLVIVLSIMVFALSNDLFC